MKLKEQPALVQSKNGVKTRPRTKTGHGPSRSLGTETKNPYPQFTVTMKLNEPFATLETDAWFPHARPVLTIAEVAYGFAMSENQVRALVEQGTFVAAAINCDSHRARAHMRIERWSVVAWRLNLLADQGQELPFKESPQIAWWRQTLRDRISPKTKRRLTKASAASAN